jgi:hypothetical protein
MPIFFIKPLAAAGMLALRVVATAGYLVAGAVMPDEALEEEQRQAVERVFEAEGYARLMLVSGTSYEGMLTPVAATTEEELAEFADLMTERNTVDLGVDDRRESSRSPARQRFRRASAPSEPARPVAVAYLTGDEGDTIRCVFFAPPGGQPRDLLCRDGSGRLVDLAAGTSLAVEPAG